jgi:hypothetical protein
VLGLDHLHPTHTCHSSPCHLHPSATSLVPCFIAAGTSTISYDSILEKFRAIERPIDKYLTLRDLLRLAPKVYYDLLLKHTEEILPFIYTVRHAALCTLLIVTCS